MVKLKPFLATYGATAARPLTSWLTASITKSLLVLNESYRVCIEGISSRQGSHHVAHTLRKTTLPRSDSSETVVPSSFSSLKSAAWLPAATGASDPLPTSDEVEMRAPRCPLSTTSARPVATTIPATR